MKPKTRQLRGFYAVVDVSGGRADPCAAVVQLRIKPAPAGVVLAEARRLRAELRDALFIVNDRIDIALAAGADGVHLGQTDIALADARRMAGDLLIGVSTHDLAQVAAAVEGGADYIGYGPVFATGTKRDPDPVQGVDALRAAVARAAPVPVVAIGGITPERAAQVAATGCAAACAIASVNGAADPAAAARAIAAAFRAPSRP
jgi:thiamine-phosphate pyrophosphorylase